MLVYIYQAALICEECGEKCREKLTEEGRAPEDPDDEASFDSDNFPKGPTEEGESDSPSHCDHCNVFLETRLTGEGIDQLLDDAEAILQGLREPGAVFEQWIAYYERHDSRFNLVALAENGQLTIGEILDTLVKQKAEVKKLSAECERLRNALVIKKGKRKREQLPL